MTNTVGVLRDVILELPAEVCQRADTESNARPARRIP
jgi:hypothetical protein